MNYMIMCEYLIHFDMISNYSEKAEQLGNNKNYCSTMGEFIANQ
jgi:hypothetical protein